MKTLACSQCGAPATHEVLPRPVIGRVYACKHGALLLPASARRALTWGDFGMLPPHRGKREAAPA